MVEIEHVLVLSGFAALVRYAQKFTGPKDERPAWEWGIASIHVGTGAFVGLVASYAAGPTWEARYVYVAIALAGYGGHLTLDWGWQVLTEAGASLIQKAARKLGPKGQGMDQEPKD